LASLGETEALPDALNETLGLVFEQGTQAIFAFQFAERLGVLIAAPQEFWLRWMETGDPAIPKRRNAPVKND